MRCFIRYVNCPIRQDDENLAAIQFNGELYYRTSRDVKAGEEVESLFIIYNRVDPTSFFLAICLLW